MNIDFIIPVLAHERRVRLGQEGRVFENTALLRAGATVASNVFIDVFSDGLRVPPNLVPGRSLGH